MRELGVLGPTTVRSAGVPVALRPRELDVLAALALDHPRLCPMAALVETLWPLAPPATAKTAVHNHVARLRRALGADAIVTEAAAYRLGPEWTLDTEQFDANVARARRGALDGDHTAARVYLERALAALRGDAFADLPDSGAVVGARLRRHQLKLAIEDEYVIALISASDLVGAISHASAHVAAEPYREQRWTALALALYRDGQRRESVLALRRGRAALRDVAGLEAGPAIAQLESLILADDASLFTSSPASLVGRSGGANGAPRDVFVGRDALLDRIRQLLLPAFDEGRPLTIELVGAPGIGKSALVHRVAMQAAIDGWHVLTTTCHAEPTRPLEPLGDVVRQLVGHETNPVDVFEADLLADLTTLWRGVPGLSARGDLSEAVVNAVAHHAHRFPTLIVVDDAHLLTPTARALLRRFGRITAPVAVVTASRTHSGGAEDTDSIAIELPGLDREDIGRLLELTAGVEVTQERINAVFASTAGNPSQVPGALRDDSAFLSALESLSPAVRAVAAVLAVGGGALDAAVMAAALPAYTHVEVEVAIAEALAGGIVRRDVDDRIDLSAAALRDAVLFDLIDTDRDDLHESIGEALVADGNLLAAAPHLLAAPGREPERAVDVARSAAAIAAHSTMYVEAAGLLETATAIASVTFGPTDTRTLSLKLARAENLRRAGDPASVDLVWDVVRAADATGDRTMFALAAAALCALGPLTNAGTIDTEVADVVERAIAQSEHPALRAYCAGEATLFYSMSGRVDRCRSHFDDALHHARLTGDDRVLLGVLGNVYPSLSHPDDWPLRRELAEELLALAERIDDDDARFQALHLYFSTQLIFGDPLLRTTFAQQEVVAARLRSAARRWMVGYQRACVAHLDGRLDDVLALNDENARNDLVAESRRQSNYWLTLLVVRLAQGRGPELAADIDAVIAAQPGLPAWRGPAAWLAALQGDADRVRHECDQLAGGATLPRDMPWSGAAMLLGRATAAIGDPDRSARVRALLEPYSGLMTWIGSATVGPFDLALAELALATDDVEAARFHIGVAQHIVGRLRAAVFQPDLDRVASACA